MQDAETQYDQTTITEAHLGNIGRFTDTIVIDKTLVHIQTGYHTLTSVVPMKLVIGSQGLISAGDSLQEGQAVSLNLPIMEQETIVHTNTTPPQSQLTYKAFDHLNRKHKPKN